MKWRLSYFSSSLHQFCFKVTRLVWMEWILFMLSHSGCWNFRHSTTARSFSMYFCTSCPPHKLGKLIAKIFLGHRLRHFLAECKLPMRLRPPLIANVFEITRSTTNYSRIFRETPSFCSNSFLCKNENAALRLSHIINCGLIIICLISCAIYLCVSVRATHAWQSPNIMCASMAFLRRSVCGNHIIDVLALA